MKVCPFIHTFFLNAVIDKEIQLRKDLNSKHAFKQNIWKLKAREGEVEKGSEKAT